MANNKIKNFISTSYNTLFGDKKKTNVKSHVFSQNIDRIKQDVTTWRAGVKEAENTYNPFRVKMQQTFLDTVLNGHVQACLLKRKNLTLLKDFQICNKAGVVNEKATEILQSRWFYDLLNYIWDALPYGYSYINWTDVTNGKLAGIQLIQRELINPDRRIFSPFTYGISGISFDDEELKDWTIFVDTPSENGMSKCGYGFLYKVAIYEIYLRNLLGYNGDYVELFAQPYRVGKTTKTDEVERGEFEAAVQQMGSAGYMIADPTDEITFLSDHTSGTGYKSYESFQKRCEETISKVLLGHAAALDSTPGKLGNNDEALEALGEIENADNRFIEYVINDILFPKLISLGVIKLAPGEYFEFLNNKEELDKRNTLADINKKIVDVVETLTKNGYKVPADWVEKETTIPVTEVVTKPTTEMSKEVKNKLEKLYN